MLLFAFFHLCLDLSAGVISRNPVPKKKTNALFLGLTHVQHIRFLRRVNALCLQSLQPSKFSCWPFFILLAHIHDLYTRSPCQLRVHVLPGHVSWDSRPWDKVLPGRSAAPRMETRETTHVETLLQERQCTPLRHRIRIILLYPCHQWLNTF